MKIIGIIPARLASSRFPNKPMIDICGIPMIGHVFLRSKFSTKLDELYVAACDNEIKEYMEGIGGKVVMTSDKHERASERTAEAITIIENSLKKNFDYVVMIQGDLPLIMPEMINELIGPLEKDPHLKVVDMISQIQDENEFVNPNNVKVVMDLNNFAMYYSREPIPSRKKYNGTVPMWRQPGLIMFERQTLFDYIKLKPTPLEKIESVDMNRFLEHGIKIKFAKTLLQFYSIDTPSDVKRVVDLMSKDLYFPEYKKGYERKRNKRS